MVEAWETPKVGLALVEVGLFHARKYHLVTRKYVSLNFSLTHTQEAMMEVSMGVLEALETRAVGLGAKGLVGWEEVGAEEDMGPTLETWGAEAPAVPVAVLFSSFPTSLRSCPM